MCMFVSILVEPTRPFYIQAGLDPSCFPRLLAFADRRNAAAISFPSSLVTLFVAPVTLQQDSD